MSTTTPVAATTLDDINNRAHVLAITRRQLNVMVQELNAAVQALQAENMPKIRECITLASTAWDELATEIQANPQLFVKPRKVHAHGILFGMELNKAKLEIADDDKTVKLIRKHLPDQASVLIASKESPVKAALEKLPADQLKRIGVNVIAAKDTVVIRPAESDVDKLVKALIKATLEEAAE